MITPFLSALSCRSGVLAAIRAGGGAPTSINAPAGADCIREHPDITSRTPKLPKSNVSETSRRATALRPRKRHCFKLRIAGAASSPRFAPGAALLQSELLQGFFYCRDTLLQQAEPVEWGPLVLGTLVAAVSAYLSIHFFMRLIEQVGMLPFVIYRLLLGVFLLLLFV